MSSPSKPEYDVIMGVKRFCDAPEGCDQIITNWAQPKGYTGAVYCLKHAYLATKISKETR